jgi:hypothetical protein
LEKILGVKVPPTALSKKLNNFKVLSVEMSVNKSVKLSAQKTLLTKISFL